MKQKRLIVMIFWVLLGAMHVSSQSVTICPWDENKQAAVVLTFDDWTPGQYPIAVSELKQRNLTATFFLMERTINSTLGWQHANNTAAFGMELGNHTITHPDMTKLTASQLSDDIRDMKSLIETHVPSQSVVSFAYPFGAFNQEVIDSLRATDCIASRSVFRPSAEEDYKYDFAATDNDYYLIKTYGMDSSITLSMFRQQIDHVIKGGGLLTFMYHSVDDARHSYHDNWYARVLQDSLQKQLDLLVSLKEKVWITTMGQAVKYHREAASAKVTNVYPYDGHRWSFRLTDDLNNDAIYNQPLSLKVHIPGVHRVEFTQDGRLIKMQQTGDNSFLVNVIPNSGDVELKVLE